MALSRYDHEVIKEIVDGAVKGAMIPIGELLVKHNMTLYGPDEKSGMVKEVCDIKDWRDKLNLRIAAVGGGMSVVVVMIKSAWDNITK